MRPLVFTDLDDTLFSTLRKLGGQEGLRQATTATNGRHSFMTPRQAALFAWLSETADLVPVTARSREAFARVHLPFAGPAILSMGAVVQGPDGALDPAWHARLAEIAARRGPELAALLAAVPEAIAGTGLRRWIVEEEGLPVYLCAKANAEAAGEIDAALGALEAQLAGLAPEGIRITRNGNNLAAIPAEVSKRQAVEWLAERLGGAERPVIGVGDSLSDLGFMLACDMAMFPAAAQIARAGLAGRHPPE